MPLIISVTNQKGGVGKSTLALNLASYFSRSGVPSAVVDTDAQGSIASLVGTFGEGDAYGTVNLVARKTFGSFSELANLKKYEVLLIDTPPYLSTDLAEIFRISDFVLVPTKPAAFDMFAIEGTLELIRKAQKQKPDLKVGVVINMSMPGSKHVEEIRTYLKNKGVSVLATEIVKRVEFERCLLSHDSIFASTDEKAKDEIKNLGDEIIAKIEEELVGL